MQPQIIPEGPVRSKTSFAPMEGEKPRKTLTVSVRTPSFPMEDPQSGASSLGADAPFVAMGRTIFESTVNGTSGVTMGSALSRKNMSITGTISIKEFHVHASVDTNQGYQNDYIDCRKLLQSTTSAKDLTTHLKNGEHYINGTCDWFLDLPEYQSWHSGEDRPLLLFLGNAGMGKTMMCHFLINNLLDEDKRQDRRRTVAYFYCDYHSQRSKATAVLSGLLLQLLQKRKDSFENIQDDYLQYKESLLHDFDNLRTVFYRFLKSLDGDVYLIIDGMDKCNESSRQSLLAIFMNSLGLSNTNLTIKILLTSRSKSDFSAILNRPMLKVGVVEQTNISEHLSTSVSEFIRVRVESLPVSPDVKHKIHNIIRKKAGDTYLWASFVLQDLDRALTNEEVDMKLQNLPGDLHEVYDRMLRDIDSAKAEEAAFILRMATLTRRPLKLKELGLLYTLRPRKWNFCGFRTLEQVKHYESLHATCKSLVHLDSSGAMRFVHQSAKEYLLDRRLSIIYSSNNFLTRRKFPMFGNSRIYNFIASAVGKSLGTLGLIRGISRYHVVPEKTHLLLLKICWSCISTKELQHGKRIVQRKEDGELSPNPDLHRVLGLRPELTYMVKEWQEHALAAGPSLHTCRAWLSDNLHKLPTLRDVWLHRVVLAGDVNIARLLLNHHADVKTRWGEHGSILHGPSSSGNEEMVKLLLDHKADIDAKGRLFDNALEAASFNGHTKVVQLLLEREATVNAQDGNSCLALQIAAKNGYTGIVHTLLRYGANVNSSDGREARPLQGAAHHGGLELVQLLLEHGADVNAQGPGHAYALQAASSGGYLDVVKLLVGHGADINATGGRHGSALDAAVDEGHDEVKKWLTEHGAESSRKKDQFDNQLYLAALMGSVEKVTALLEQYDVNVQGGEHGSPLQAAAYEGHENVVRFLIDSRANVNARGGKHGSPLQAAADKGHDHIVRLLIDKGADVNAQGGVQGNALHAASVNGHVETMRELLSHGVSANIRGEAYGSALHAALRAESCDKKDAVRLLLEYNALPNVQSSYYGTPLMLAAYNGEVGIAELLVDNGANVNANGGKYGFALQAAAVMGRKDMVEFLLKHGANVNAKGGEYGFALQAAAFHGGEEIVQLLLDSGAVVNAEGGHYGFALQAAAAAGKIDVVKLLLNRDANVDAQGGLYGFALQAAAFSGQEDIIKYLLDHGAEINAEGGKYGFALQAAAYKGNIKVVDLLLIEDARINAEGGLYGTALNAARRGKHESVVQLLQRQGTRFDEIDCWGMHRIGSWG